MVTVVTVPVVVVVTVAIHKKEVSLNKLRAATTFSTTTHPCTFEIFSEYEQFWRLHSKGTATFTRTDTYATTQKEKRETEKERKKKQRKELCEAGTHTLRSKRCAHDSEATKPLVFESHMKQHTFFAFEMKSQENSKQE
jgi:hypothetical protein